MPNQTIRGFQQVIEADAQADFLNHLESYQSGMSRRLRGISVAPSVRTLLAYFSLMLSSIATALYLEKSSGDI